MTDSGKKSENFFEKHWRALMLAAMAIWLAWWILAPLLSKYVVTNGDGSPATTGQIGDMFGSLNALFTCFAFCGLVYTIILQRRDMKDAKDKAEADLKAQKNQLTLTMKSLELQKKQNSSQSFAGLFQSLISAQRDSLNSVKTKTSVGWIAINHILGLLNEKMSQNAIHDMRTYRIEANRLREEQTGVTIHVNRMLGILRAIDKFNIDIETKFEYMSCYRSIVTFEERIAFAVFLIIATDFDDSPMSPLCLVRKYALLSDCANQFFPEYAVKHFGLESFSPEQAYKLLLKQEAKEQNV